MPAQPGYHVAGGGGSGAVTSVSAADASIIVAGTASAPTIQAGSDIYRILAVYYK